jgi:plastocyanin
MKKINFIIFILLALVLVGAGCFTTPSASTPTPSVNTNASEINITLPANENTQVPAAVDSSPSLEEPSASATVLIENLSFNPPSVIITAGGEVTWTNSDLVNHTVTGEGWDSGLFGKDRSFTKKFDTPGVYPYHCTPYPDMTGRVVVK